MYEQIQSLHKMLRDRIRDKWRRVLPFNEEITDRWEKADYLGFGKGTSIYDSSLVLGDVKVGSDTWIGPYTILDGSGGLEIGSHCSIAAGVQVYTHDTIKWALTGGKGEPERASVKIGDCCYIGPGAVISKGVVIGNHCVIGAGSLVNKSLPDSSIASGVPCRILGRVVIDENGNVELEYFA